MHDPSSWVLEVTKNLWALQLERRQTAGWRNNDVKSAPSWMIRLAFGTRPGPRRISTLLRGGFMRKSHHGFLANYHFLGLVSKNEVNAERARVFHLSLTSTTEPTSFKTLGLLMSAEPRWNRRLSHSAREPANKPSLAQFKKACPDLPHQCNISISFQYSIVVLMLPSFQCDSKPLAAPSKRRAVIRKVRLP